MSRVLKFRVWGKTEKEYIRYPFAWLSLFDSPDGLEIEENEDLVIEQYTGLKDKNGKEIYEGDIVSEHNGDITGEIIQQATGTWLIRWIGGGGSEADATVLFEEHYLCDVIGNIHEPPKEFRPEHLKRMGVTMVKGDEE